MFKAILLGTAGMFFSATLIEWAGVNGIASIQNIEKADQIIPMILQRGMNPFLASIFIAGIVAAGMSTIDGILVTTTGAVTRDIYQKIMERLDGRNVRIVVDATKDLLLNVLGHHPFLIKPNNHELGDIFGVKLSERIYARAEKIWPRYLRHPFVTQMADGTLPPEKFRYYMLQDYLYLRDYVKIFAAIIQKADDFEQIRFLSGELANTIDETFRTHRPYMERLGITEEEIRRARPHIDSVAYSHYMLCEAQMGDVLTGLVTLLNCSWSYAYIAEETVKRYPHALQDARYGAWFAGYVSEEYRRTNQALIDRIDALAASVSEERVGRLCEIFEKCCLFDLRFWDMVYTMGEE